ncbi:MAG TPA: hypothetical protein ENH84_00780 [Phycisphaerae bacterium]|nr:hypothetical protein [Phycisphaerae bacterium]
MAILPNRLTVEQEDWFLLEYQRRKAKQAVAAGLNSPLLAELFQQQRDFVLDPETLRAVLCNRRSGKTFAVSSFLMWTALQEPGWDCLYLNLTSKLTRQVIWDGPDGLKACARRNGISASFHNQSMTVLLPNGSKILCGGAENADDIEMYRGLKFKAVVVDEAGAFKAHLEELITSVLQPTTVDMDGVLILSGTPGKILAGLFYNATRSDGKRNLYWSFHQWSVLDNPHISNAAEKIAKILKVNKWDESNPTFQREWLGNWVVEESTLVYKFPGGTKCLYKTLPAAKEWYHILGIDLGWSSPSSFRVISYSPQLSKVYLQDRFQKTHMGITAIHKQIEKYEEKYDFCSIVADAGALGKTIVEEINERFSRSIKAAEKTHKADFIEALNDDLRMGRIQVLEDDPIIEEWARLQWENEEHKKEDPRFANHDADATLYGWRESKHFAHITEVRPPAPGDDAFAEYEEARMLEVDIGKFGSEKEDQPWWEYEDLGRRDNYPDDEAFQ